MAQYPYEDSSSTTSSRDDLVSPAAYPDDTTLRAPVEGFGSNTASDRSEPSVSSSTVEDAKQQGKQVGQEAVEGGKQVASVAADQATSVAAEAGEQAKNLLTEARSQLSSQASAQQGNLASWLHSFADELRELVDGRSGQARDKDGVGGEEDKATSTSGVATRFASQASEQAHGVADWLEKREPGDLLEEAARFARRKPGTFLAIAAVGGLVAGRLTRGLTANSSDDTRTDLDVRGVDQGDTAGLGVGGEYHGTGIAEATSGNDSGVEVTRAESLEAVDPLETYEADRR